ncbi:hypothetical protein GCM10020219_026090 [Nonomuraea dietziae]
MKPSAPRMKAGQPIGSGSTAAGTVNSASSGRPASAALRRRVTNRSTTIAMSPTPAVVSMAIGGSSGTGAAKRWMSAKPVASRSSSAPADSLVGTSSAHAFSPV